MGVAFTPACADATGSSRRSGATCTPPGGRLLAHVGSVKLPTSFNTINGLTNGQVLVGILLRQKL